MCVCDCDCTTHHSQFSRLGIQCPTLVYVMLIGSGVLSILSEFSCLASVLCTCFSRIYRAMVKRHDLLEKKLERAESTLSAKAEAKATIQREV